MCEVNETIAIQETYGPRFRNCWGCGSENDMGLHLKSYPSKDKKKCIARIKPDKQFTGGVPNNLFGGMIAMIFDCHGTASAAFFKHDAKGETLDKNTIIDRFITARLEVDYIKPTPIDRQITVESILEELGERKAIVNMQMIVDGSISAKARIIAVGVKDNM